MSTSSTTCALRGLITPACVTSSEMYGIRLERAMAGRHVGRATQGALKQVSACEYNPFGAIQTNHHGARKCHRCGHQPGGAEH